MATYPCHHISMSIERPPSDVIAFLGDMANWPKWASGLGDTFQASGDGTIRIAMADGPMTLRLAGVPEHGVFDHVVTAADGRTFYNPLRVLPNGDGAEVVFTLYRMRDADDAAFERDAAWIARDLATLKRLVEGAVH